MTTLVRWAISMASVRVWSKIILAVAD